MSGTDLYAKRPHEMTLSERFWSKVTKSPGCWEHSNVGTPYPKISLRSVPGRGRGEVLAHRLSWELHFGVIPPGQWVLHRCDNPRCVRPDHLFLGTVIDNNADMKAKGRASPGSKHYATALSEDDVRSIRTRRAAGEFGRHLAREFCLSEQALCDIVKFRTWKHVA